MGEMKKPDEHGIFVIQENEDYWSCGFGKCSRKPEFIIVEIFWRKKNAIEERKGACRECAIKWANKDNCESCLRRIAQTPTKESQAKGNSNG